MCACAKRIHLKRPRTRACTHANISIWKHCIIIYTYISNSYIVFEKKIYKKSIWHMKYKRHLLSARALYSNRSVVRCVACVAGLQTNRMGWWVRIEWPGTYASTVRVASGTHLTTSRRYGYTGTGWERRRPHIIFCASFHSGVVWAYFECDQIKT